MKKIKPQTKKKRKGVHIVI